MKINFCVAILFATVYLVENMTHPGVLLNKAQLDFVKGKIDTGIWKTAFDKMKGDRLASLDFDPKPHKTVECGSYSKPNIGCSEERESALSAYTHALIWAYKGDKAHAKKAIDIMNKWAETLTKHNNSNSMLQTGWSGTGWTQAAEIIKHTDAGWEDSQVKKFGDMLRNVYLPNIKNGAPDKNGNWELIMLDAITGIAVFLDDQATFDHAVEMWRKRVDAYIYLESDGATPHPPPGSSKKSHDQIVEYWQGQSKFVDGLGQETCRDFSHMTMGLAAMINTAETARHQGLDLYKEKQERIVKSMEFHANYINGASHPSWLCKGKLDISLYPMWEIAYNHYHGAKGVDMPHTEQLITKKLRPAGTDSHMVAWQTLTHAENPN